MLQVASDPGLCARMGKALGEKVKGHTPQQWAEDFERIVFTLLPRGSCDGEVGGTNNV